MFKSDVKRLNEEYQTKCIVASSNNGWMDEALTEQYCREVIGMFSFGMRRLLAWDAFRCHLTPRLNDIFNRAKVDSVSSMVHAKACYLDGKHFTSRRKKSIPSTLMFQKKR